MTLFGLRDLTMPFTSTAASFGFSLLGLKATPVTQLSQPLPLRRGLHLANVTCGLHHNYSDMAPWRHGNGL